MRAIVLSGGGAKGSWMCGILQHLLGDLQIHYDIICGVSVGAINGAFIAQFKQGEEKICAHILKKMWLNLDNYSVYKRWFPFGRLHAIWKNSFYDSSPLHNLIKENIFLNKIRASGKIVNVGTVSLSSGKYTIFNQASDHFIDAVISSASFPGMFIPVKYLDQLWADGGIKELSPLQKAIDLGADIIDVVITSPQTRIKNFIEKPTIVDILKRSIDLSTDKIMSNDIDKVYMHNTMAEAGLLNKKIVKLNILRPDYNLIEDVLDFNPEKIAEMMKMGYNDAKNKFVL